MMRSTSAVQIAEDTGEILSDGRNEAKSVSSDSSSSTRNSLKEMSSLYHNIDIAAYNKVLSSLRTEHYEAVQFAKQQGSTARALAVELDQLRASSEEVKVENDELLNDMQDLMEENEEMRKKMKEVVLSYRRLKVKFNVLRKEKDQLEETLETYWDGKLSPKIATKQTKRAQDQMDHHDNQSNLEQQELTTKCARMEQENNELKAQLDSVVRKNKDKDIQILQLAGLVTQLRHDKSDPVETIHECNCNAKRKSNISENVPTVSEDRDKRDIFRSKREISGLWKSFNEQLFHHVRPVVNPPPPKGGCAA